MMRLLAKFKAGKTMIKESYKVINSLNHNQFHNSYHKVKTKSLLLRLIRFWKNLSMSIINSLT